MPVVRGTGGSMSDNTEKSKRVIRAGEEFLLSDGSYDTYKIYCICTAIADIDIDNELAEYLELYPMQRQKNHFRHGEFRRWLQGKRLFDTKQLPGLDLWCGDYGHSEILLDGREP